MKSVHRKRLSFRSKTSKSSPCGKRDPGTSRSVALPPRGCERRNRKCSDTDQCDCTQPTRIFKCEPRGGNKRDNCRSHQVRALGVDSESRLTVPSIAGASPFRPAAAASPSEVRRARMRARSCIFAFRNRLKRDRSPDFCDMLTSFLVRRKPFTCLSLLAGRGGDLLSALRRTVAVQLCTMPDEPNKRSFQRFEDVAELRASTILCYLSSRISFLD
jgi:hypothetical protein